MSLTERPLTSVQYRGQEYLLNLSFDNIIKLYELLADTENFSNQVNDIYKLLSVDGLESDSNELKLLTINAVLDYLSEKPYDSTAGKIDITGELVDDGETLPDFNFKQDAGAIYASFRQYYGIDLNKEKGKMHWDTFIALFDNLGSDTPINRIRSIRNDDLTAYEGEDKIQQKQQVIELQEYYMLDEVREIKNQQQEEQMANPFAGFFDGINTKT